MSGKKRGQMSSMPTVFPTRLLCPADATVAGNWVNTIERRLQLPREHASSGAPCPRCVPASWAERISPEYLAQILAHGLRLLLYGKQYNREHGMEGSHAAEHFERILHPIELLMTYDKVDVVNSAGVECRLRRAYGVMGL